MTDRESHGQALLDRMLVAGAVARVTCSRGVFFGQLTLDRVKGYGSGRSLLAALIGAALDLNNQPDN